MKADVYQQLKALRDCHGSRECGKICQKLLAISFRRAGYDHIVERGVQGVDVDAGHADGQRYAVEVKTTEGTTIQFEPKDVEGLNKRRIDGYQPILGVLRLNYVLYEWYLAKADSLKPGSISFDSLRPFRLRALEVLIGPLFDEAVNDYFAGTMGGGQAYLEGILRELSGRVTSPVPTVLGG